MDKYNHTRKQKSAAPRSSRYDGPPIRVSKHFVEVNGDRITKENIHKFIDIKREPLTEFVRERYFRLVFIAARHVVKLISGGNKSAKVQLCDAPSFFFDLVKEVRAPRKVARKDVPSLLNCKVRTVFLATEGEDAKALFDWGRFYKALEKALEADGHVFFGRACLLDYFDKAAVQAGLNVTDAAFNSARAAMAELLSDYRAFNINMSENAVQQRVKFAACDLRKNKSSGYHYSKKESPFDATEHDIDGVQLNDALADEAPAVVDVVSSSISLRELYAQLKPKLRPYVNLILKGKTYEEMAASQKVKPHTARYAVQQIKKKMLEINWEGAASRHGS